jgi:hypothetical protein
VLVHLLVNCELQVKVVINKIGFGVLVALVGVSANASEYGCKVLLCLANPASNGRPKGVAECVDPLNRLYRDLRKGKPFPTCDLADGNDGRSYARRVIDPYDPCPTGTQPAPPGAAIIQGARQASQRLVDTVADGAQAFSVVGQPAVSQQPAGDSANQYGPLACVGHQVGQYRATGIDDAYDVMVFDRVVWQPPQSPAAIDVWVDGKLQQRVRD